MNYENCKSEEKKYTSLTLTSPCLQNGVTLAAKPSLFALRNTTTLHKHKIMNTEMETQTTLTMIVSTTIAEIPFQLIALVSDF